MYLHIQVKALTERLGQAEADLAQKQEKLALAEAELSSLRAEQARRMQEQPKCRCVYVCVCVFVQVYVLRFAANTNTHREGRRKKERSKKGSFNGTWSASFMIFWLRLSTCAPGDRGKAQVAIHTHTHTHTHTPTASFQAPGKPCYGAAVGTLLGLMRQKLARAAAEVAAQAT